MKTKSLLLPVFLLSILANSLFCEAGEAPAPAEPDSDLVLDTSGKPLRIRFTYYILPVSHGSGGGLELTNTNNTKCPLDVVQSSDDTPGIPATFFPFNLNKDGVPVLTDLNIMFPNRYTTCPESPVWKLDHYSPTEPSDKVYFITTGGVVGNPAPETLRNWFKIKKFGDGYKFVHCPSVCSFCDIVCKDVGIIVQNGKRRVALTDVPYNVVFKRA